MSTLVCLLLLASGNPIAANASVQHPSDFQRYDATIYNEQTGDFSLLLIENIMPGTEYEYYAVSGTDAQGNVKTFTTSPIVNLKNNTFDEWFKNGKTWFPNVDVSKWWDSGNTGANAPMQ